MASTKERGRGGSPCETDATAGELGVDAARGAHGEAALVSRPIVSSFGLISPTVWGWAIWDGRGEASSAVLGFLSAICFSAGDRREHLVCSLAASMGLSGGVGGLSASTTEATLATKKVRPFRRRRAVVALLPRLASPVQVGVVALAGGRGGRERGLPSHGSVTGTSDTCCRGLPMAIGAD